MSARLTRTQAVALLLGVVTGAAEEIGASPMETLEIEEGGREALRTLGVTADELAVASQVVAQL